MSAPHDTDRVETIVEKVEYIERCLSILSEKQSVSRETYENSAETKDIVERRFEKLTQACIDIARMLLRDLAGEAPDTNAAAMQQLHDQGVLSAAVSEEMARAAQFRNILAHRYGDVLDDEIVYSALQDLSRYRAFVEELRAYLARVDVL